jgi:hypothetical protein
MPSQSLAQEPLGRSQIAPLAEPELDCVAIAVNRAVKIPSLASDVDVDTV